MKSEINAIIFDFDGVIVDSGEDIANAVIYTLKLFDMPMLPESEIISYVGRGAVNLIRMCFKECDEVTLQKAVIVYRSYYLDNCLINTKLYPNVKETLRYFRNKDKKLALVTNKPEDLTHKILIGLGVNAYFSMVIGPESVRKMKPDPEGILKVLENFSEYPKNAIMVGDSYTDVEVGRNAGTLTCGVTYGLGDVSKLLASVPDYVIDDIDKLTDIIE